ncbi:MAG: CBS domain-containing protein [Alphaproteobacteria bacterium]|nr:CBS domain-containing protein [Alphaproteobacteria bacterium]
MSVANILAVKGRDVVTATADYSLHELISLLSEKGIGAVVVVDRSGDIAGIISERDVMRAIAKFGAAALDERVSSHMTRHVETAQEDASVMSVMQRMTKGRFRHMPVVGNGQLAGVISIGDLIKNRLADMESEQQALKEYIGAA